MIRSFKKLLTKVGNPSPDNEKPVEHYLAKAEEHYKNDEYDDAIKEYCRCLTALKGKEGKTLKVAKIYKNLSVIYREGGFYSESLTASEKALKITKTTLPKGDPYNAEVFLNMAETYLKEDRFHETVNILLEAEQILLKQEPRNEPLLCNLYAKLGEAMSGQDRFKQAYDYLDRAVGVIDSSEQTGKQLMSNIQSTLARVASRKGDNEKALEHLEKVMIDQEAFEVDSRMFAQVFQEISSTYTYMGKYDEAAKRLAKTLEIRKKFYSESGHVELAQSNLELALLYYLQKDYTRALDFTKKSIKITETTYGQYHFYNGKAHRHLGLIFNELQNYEEALSSFNKALSIFKALYGENHIHLAQIYQDIGDLYEAKQDMKKCATYMKKSLKLLTVWAGKTHPRIAEVYLRFVQIYTIRGKPAKAEKNFKLALQVLLDCVHHDANLGDTFEMFPFALLLELLNKENSYLKIATTFKNKLQKIKEEANANAEMKKDLTTRWKDLLSNMRLSTAEEKKIMSLSETVSSSDEKPKKMVKRQTSL